MIRKLAGQTIIYGLSTIVPRFINFLLTPYLVYHALSVYEYGIVGYFYSTIPFLLSLLTLGMENAFFKFTGKYDDPKKKLQIFNTSTTFITLLSIIFFCGVVLFQREIFETINQNFAESIISIIAAIIAIDAITAIAFARLREEQKSMRFVTIKALSVIINVAFVLFFYSLLPIVKDSAFFNWMWIENFGAGYVFLSNAIANCIILIILLYIYSDYRPRISIKMLKTILLFSIPLFISGFIGTANEFIDRQMMRILIPTDESMIEIGIYSASIKIAGLMIIFTTMYRYAAEPLFLSKMKKNDFKENNAEAVKFFWIASMVIFLIITLFIDIFEKLVPMDYRGAISLVPIILIANILLGVQLNLSFWYKYTGKTHFALYITIVGLAVNVGFNLLYMETMGYTSAAYAKMLAVLSMVIISYIINQIYYPIKYDIKRIAEYTILTAILFGVGSHVSHSNFIVDNLINATLLLSFIGWATYREQIKLKI